MIEAVDKPPLARLRFVMILNSTFFSCRRDGNIRTQANARMLRYGRRNVAFGQAAG
jgi:hypothetical protein